MKEFPHDHFFLFLAHIPRVARNVPVNILLLSGQSIPIPNAVVVITNQTPPITEKDCNTSTSFL